MESPRGEFKAELTAMFAVAEKPAAPVPASREMLEAPDRMLNCRIRFAVVSEK